MRESGTGNSGDHDPEDPDERPGDVALDVESDDVVLDTEAEVACPHCGEALVMGLDPGGGTSQEYVEDCQVCCHPCRVRVNYDDDGAAEVWVEAMQ